MKDVNVIRFISVLQVLELPFFSLIDDLFYKVVKKTKNTLKKS